MKKEKTIGELAKEHPDNSYIDLERYRDEDRAQEAGACIMAEARKDREGEEQDEPFLFEQEDRGELDLTLQIEKWKEKYEKEHRLRQDAEGETTIVKGIGMNSAEMRAAQAKLKELEEGLANALAINESHQKLNGKLQERLTELEEELKRLHDHFNNKIDSARKAGL